MIFEKMEQSSNVKYIYILANPVLILALPTIISSKIDVKINQAGNTIKRVNKVNKLDQKISSDKLFSHRSSFIYCYIWQ